ncbi:MAG: hypothetical protein LBU37_03140 [Tannerellaceae bacterium]|nr:hypothetical protein [Tannerellaceae bacterium]
MNTKRLMIVMAVLFAGITTIVAQSNAEEEVPFNVNTSKLNRYLNLSSYQEGRVEALNESFIQMQRINRGEEQKIKQIIAENLAGMKKTLSKVQFDKYVALLKMTNKNNNIIDEASLADIVKQVDEK